MRRTQVREKVGLPAGRQGSGDIETSMKLAIKPGDKVRVIKGKLAGKEASIIAIDKKAKRVRLEGLKKKKVKTKKGKEKELHGTFHVSSLRIIKPEPPKEKEAAPREETASKEVPKGKAEAKEETKETKETKEPKEQKEEKTKET